MTVWPEFASEGRLLAPLAGRIDVGLHLTLTQDRPLSRVMASAYLGRLDRKALAAALARQLDAFVQSLGRPPDFIDGHQHVHLLPGVREAVIEAAARHGAYLRLTEEPLSAIARVRVAPVKAALLSILSRPLAREARRRSIPCNRGFRGARNFADAAPFGAIFRRMVADAPAGTLVMCHPGFADATLSARDPVTEARESEYLYFAGEQFPADLAAAGLRLARLDEALSGLLSPRDSP